MESMLLQALMSGAMRGGPRGGGDDEDSPDAWKRKAGTKALAMVKKANKDPNLRDEGRVSLLREAHKTASDAEAPNWGRDAEDRQQALDKLQTHIKTSEGILAASTLGEIQELVVSGVEHNDLYSDIRTIKSGAKVVMRLAQNRTCTILRDAIREKERVREQSRRQQREEGDVPPNLQEDSDE